MSGLDDSSPRILNLKRNNFTEMKKKEAFGSKMDPINIAKYVRQLSYVDAENIAKEIDRVELVTRFLDNTERKNRPFQGLGTTSYMDATEGSITTKPGKFTPAKSSENTRGPKKLYHISVRSKISPQILQLATTHKNFDTEVNVKQRAKICALLRSDSEMMKLQKQSAALH